MAVGVLEREVDFAARTQRRPCPGRVTGAVGLDPQQSHVPQVVFDVSGTCALNKPAEPPNIHVVPTRRPEPGFCGEATQLLIQILPFHATVLHHPSADDCTSFVVWTLPAPPRQPTATRRHVYLYTRHHPRGEALYATLSREAATTGGHDERRTADDGSDPGAGQEEGQGVRGRHQRHRDVGRPRRVDLRGARSARLPQPRPRRRSSPSPTGTPTPPTAASSTARSSPASP